MNNLSELQVIVVLFTSLHRNIRTTLDSGTWRQGIIQHDSKITESYFFGSI
jgi:hypothetical protein